MLYRLQFVQHPLTAVQPIVTDSPQLRRAVCLGQLSALCYEMRHDLENSKVGVGRQILLQSES